MVKEIAKIGPVDLEIIGLQQITKKQINASSKLNIEQLYSRVLDIHAPLRTGRRRCGQQDSRHLSQEARQAKQQRQRLERRYRRTGLQSDKQAYLSACSTARECIQKSRADVIKSALDEASGDVRATSQTAQRLLHSKQKVVYNDAQFAQLV